MTGFEGSMSGKDNVRKSGETQPYPKAGGSESGPASGGVVPTIVGKTTPIIVKSGATQK